jgi:chemotaxis protein MotB
MRRRRPVQEERTHIEAWAIPYGDLVTLLLAFFVVMYAVSSVNEGKYRVLSDVLNAEFRGAPRSPEPVQVGTAQRGNSQGPTILDSRQLLEGAPPQPPEAEAEIKPPDPVPPTTPVQDVSGNAQELNQVADDVEQAMGNLIRDKLVMVRRHGLWVEVEIQTDILFSSGVAALPPVAVNVLAPLADAIKPFPNPLRIEGHTDNVPIKTAEYPSNWELSAARAASVVRLFTQRGVDASRLTVIGLGEHRPLKSNATAAGRNANRRVVLVILGSEGLPEGTYGHRQQSGAN